MEAEALGTLISVAIVVLVCAAYFRSQTKIRVVEYKGEKYSVMGDYVLFEGKWRKYR